MENKNKLANDMYFNNNESSKTKEIAFKNNANNKISKKKLLAHSTI